MKIYNRIKFDIDTLEILEEESIEYYGPIVECKGGGGSGVDAEYNSRMAGISEAQLKMAQQYFQFWDQNYKPFEAKQIQENMKMLPHLTGATISEAQYKQAQYEGMLNKDSSGKSLLGLQQEYERGKLNQSLELMGDQTNVIQKAYKTALKGVDPNAAAGRAQADVAIGFQQAKQGMIRDMGRMGIGGGGGNYAASMAGLARDKAKAQAGQASLARRKAGEQQFSQLTTAAGLTR